MQLTQQPSRQRCPIESILRHALSLLRRRRDSTTRIRATDVAPGGVSGCEDFSRAEGRLPCTSFGGLDRADRAPPVRGLRMPIVSAQWFTVRMTPTSVDAPTSLSNVRDHVLRRQRPERTSRASEGPLRGIGIGKGGEGADEPGVIEDGAGLLLRPVGVQVRLVARVRRVPDPVQCYCVLSWASVM